MNKFDSIEEFLASDISDEYSEYLKYILHHLSFMVTDKFIKKYDKCLTAPQGKLLKKKL